MRQLAACIPEIAAGPPEIYFHFLHLLLPPLHTHNIEKTTKTRSSWLNWALRGDEAVYWVSIGHYEAVALIDDTGSVEGIYAFM